MHFKRDESVEKKEMMMMMMLRLRRVGAIPTYIYIASQLSDREPEELRVTKILIGIFFNPNYEIRK